MRSEAKATAGRSIQPMAMCVPLLFYVMAFAGYASYGAFGSRLAFEAALVANVAGVVSGLGEVGPALLAWWRDAPRSPAARRWCLQQAIVHGAALVVLAVNAVLQFQLRGAYAPPAGLALLLSGVGLALTVLGAYLAGTPSSERETMRIERRGAGRVLVSRPATW